LIWRYGFIAVICLGLAITLIDSWRAYFDTWVNNDNVRSSYHSDLAEIGQFLDQATVPEGTSVFVAYDYAGETTPQSFEYYSKRTPVWFDHQHTLGWRPGDSESWLLISSSRPLNEVAADKLSEIAVKDIFNFPNGEPAFTLYQFKPGELAWDPGEAFEVGFVDQPKLIGFDLPDVVYRGETIPLVLHYVIPENLPGFANRLTYAPVLLEDQEGNVWEQTEKLMGYPEAGWQAGDRFVQYLSLEIPQGMPPGPFFLRFGLSDWQGIPITMINPEMTRSGPFLLRSQPVQDINLDADAPLFGGKLALEGKSFSSLLVPGLPIDISLDWLVIEQPDADYRVVLELINPDNKEAFLSQTFDLWPDIYPPSDWMEGEQITTFHRLDIPLDIPTEVDPQLVVRLISPEDEARLPLSQGNEVLSDMSLLLREHRFELPAISHPIDAEFGDQIRLLGFDLENTSTSPSGELNLTLYWQAIETPSSGYTVFNHLIGSDGQIQGQFDSPPVSDAWLTSTWLPGEIIVDSRTIPVRQGAPLGPYRLAIGLYDAGSGERLPITVEGQSQPDDQLFLSDINIGP
jgi:hypothetical protein